MKIKVCGMVHPSNLEEVCALEPDLTGYIFVPGSRRFVGNHPDPALFRLPGAQIAKVGVFADEELSEVKRKFEQCLLDLVQLHGSESPGYCLDLVENGIPVIKVLFPGNPVPEKSAADFQRELMHYSEVVHYLLFDSGGSGSGGSGQKFSWNRLAGAEVPLPFFLGGGIGPDDAARVQAVTFTNLFGVDLNSRFESSPGIKDPVLLKRFIGEIREKGD